MSFLSPRGNSAAPDGEEVAAAAAGDYIDESPARSIVSSVVMIERADVSPLPDLSFPDVIPDDKNYRRPPGIKMMASKSAVGLFGIAKVCLDLDTDSSNSTGKVLNGGCGVRLPAEDSKREDEMVPEPAKEFLLQRSGRENNNDDSCRIRETRI